MIDNEIIQEIRQTRNKLWEDSGCDVNRFFETLMERQKKRPDFVSVVAQPDECATVVEEPKTRSYNPKN
ncbi:MAG: hypothetical protein GVY36_14275 [Verrucomicrobia bacterium]|jgi:hypothetical protein|nr:hypothetical protein [Verrucomicrobiota bacterium]